MKSKIKLLGMAFMLIVGLGACEKTYLEPEIAAPKTEAVTDDTKEVDEPINDRITNGVWRITSFQWHLREENNKFKEYTFYFLPNHVVIAVHGNVKEQGRWNRKNTLFQMNFGPERPLRDLNNSKWYFIREGKDKFVLKGLHPVNHSSQFVVFERL
ncbi:MAG: hypothetical protein H0X46_09285 [Bacteroidetes bacterium]|nr:hypothetical protein [Bacteroidota bacterium]